MILRGEFILVLGQFMPLLRIQIRFTKSLSSLSNLFVYSTTYEEHWKVGEEGHILSFSSKDSWIEFSLRYVFLTLGIIFSKQLKYLGLYSTNGFSSKLEIDD